MPALVLALLTAAAGPGTFGPIQLSPPEGFQPVPSLALAGTTALAPVVVEGEPERRLVALLETEGAQPATFALSTIDAPLEVTASTRAALTAAVVAHFEHQLGLPLTVEHAQLATQGTPRLEIWGHLEAEGGQRVVGVALYPGAVHHAVAVASLPAPRAEALRPSVETALGALTLHEEPPPQSGWQLLHAALWLGAALTFIALRVRRMRSLRNPGKYKAESAAGHVTIASTGNPGNPEMTR